MLLKFALIFGIIGLNVALEEKIKFQVRTDGKALRFPMNTNILKENANKSSTVKLEIQPRSLPYTPAERRSYVHKARLEALRDDSYDDFTDLMRSKKVSSYDSSEEDYSDTMQRAIRPFNRFRNYFRPSQPPYLKSVESSTEKPTFINRFKSYFRQATTKSKPVTKPPQVQKHNNGDSQYEVLFWPITSINSQGTVSTNLIPHLVVRNPEKSNEILYAVPLVKLSRNGNINIFQTSENQEINSIKKIKPKVKKQKRKNKNNRKQPSQVNDEGEAILKEIIQSDADGEYETATAKPPTVPSFILVEDTLEDPMDNNDDNDDDEDDDLDYNIESNLKNVEFVQNRNRNYYKKKNYRKPIRFFNKL